VCPDPRDCTPRAPGPGKGRAPPRSPRRGKPPPHPPPRSKELDLGDAAQAAAYTAALLPMLESGRWEDRLGAITGLTLAVPALGAPAAPGAAAFSAQCCDACLRFLEDREPRVRLAVADCIGALSAADGVAAPRRCFAAVVSSIRENFERDFAEPSGELPGRPTGGTGAGDSAAVDGGPEGDTAAAETDLLGDLLGAAYTAQVPGRGDMRHGTEGWKCLETSCRALQRMMEGSGHAFRPLVSDDLRRLVYRTLLHPNRFVRESGYFATGAMAETFTGDEMERLGEEVAGKLRDGLSDNWSQVRFAASTAARKFVLAAPEGVRERAWPLVLPPMCLNRYYVAEGVRLYSQESWRLAVGTRGRDLVAAHAPQVVDYYIEQSKANNHAVREAACACMAELMAKVDRGAVAPHAPAMLRALVNCFKDDSWPVRDAACTACGRCVASCPEESREVLPELLPLWRAHLWDNIPSVRQNSAQSLSMAARAYGGEVAEQCWAALDELLPKALEQPSDSKRFGGMDNITQFGVAGARRIRANDVDAHTNQQMFSCGSLAPKLRRGGGCMDHGFKREQEPWEATDGALHLLAELADLDPPRAASHLPLVADLAGLQTFMHAFSLQETVFRCLPRIARAVGKRAFKGHLEELLPPLFRALTCGHQLAEHAAGACLGFVRDLIGPNILAGRLEPDQADLLRTSPLVPPSSFGAAGGGAAPPAVGTAH